MPGKSRRSGETVSFVFSVSLLAGCVAVIIFALQPELATEAVLLRAFIVFVAAATATTFFLVLWRPGRRGAGSQVLEGPSSRGAHEEPPQIPTQR